ncbi:hypothetical protein BDZ94DRAFT_1324675 [Collybia nuda]|uniref:Uncharacterized protein n=1 Tax=Collybia nuda TaxID=64659 RepID=A0A9P6CBJ4_9AGAR|nr:hypothetical protein BDZ94DRAFT_1324675 [Collybia nuda]
MDTPHALALGVFTSYFLIIITLFTIILRSIPKAGNGVNRRKTWLFRFLTLGSLAHTWLYMFKFMAWSFDNYESLNPTTISSAPLERLTSWLLNTSLFEQAWAAVCFGPINWWWSEQLCVYTVIWTLFLVIEGRAKSIKHLWAYMLLGQLVAISVASNLFYLAILHSTPTQRSSKLQNRVTPLVTVPLVVSLLTIVVSPHTNTRTFLPNLLTMHALLVIPLLTSTPLASTRQPNAVRISKLITFISLTIVFLRFRTDIVAAFAVIGRSLPSPVSFVYSLSGFLPEQPSPSPLHAIIYTIKALVQPVSTFLATPISNYTSAFTHFISAALVEVWDTLHSHPAQSSIGWDVVWTSASLGAWVLGGGGRGGVVVIDSEVPIRLLRNRREVRRIGRGVFVSLVGFPGLVSSLTEPWAVGVEGVGGKKD